MTAFPRRRLHVPPAADPAAACTGASFVGRTDRAEIAARTARFQAARCEAGR